MKYKKCLGLLHNKNTKTKNVLFIRDWESKAMKDLGTANFQNCKYKIYYCQLRWVWQAAGLHYMTSSWKLGTQGFFSYLPSSLSPLSFLYLPLFPLCLSSSFFVPPCNSLYFSHTPRLAAHHTRLAALGFESPTCAGGTLHTLSLHWPYYTLGTTPVIAVIWQGYTIFFHFYRILLKHFVCTM